MVIMRETLFIHTWIFVVFCILEGLYSIPPYRSRDSVTSDALSPPLLYTKPPSVNINVNVNICIMQCHYEWNSNSIDYCLLFVGTLDGSMFVLLLLLWGCNCS